MYEALKELQDLAEINMETFFAAPLQTGTQRMRQWSKVLQAITKAEGRDE
jgi:hypothetical protein